MKSFQKLPAPGEWKDKLLYWVSGLLLFETLSGLAIWLLPFSVPNQVMVFVHTGAGLLFLAPFAWYQLRHWVIYRRMSLSQVVLTGYFALVAVLAAIVSGLVLTYQALFASRISYGWDLVHIIATVGLIVSVLPHVAILVIRARRPRLAQPAGSAGTSRVSRSSSSSAWASAPTSMATTPP